VGSIVQRRLLWMLDLKSGILLDMMLLVLFLHSFEGNVIVLVGPWFPQILKNTWYPNVSVKEANVWLQTRSSWKQRTIGWPVKTEKGKEKQRSGSEEDLVTSDMNWWIDLIKSLMMTNSRRIVSKPVLSDMQCDINHWEGIIKLKECLLVETSWKKPKYFSN